MDKNLIYITEINHSSKRSKILLSQVEQGYKECSTCKKCKDLSQYSIDRSILCGYTSKCKTCDKLYYNTKNKLQKRKRRKRLYIIGTKKEHNKKIAEKSKLYKKKHSHIVRMRQILNNFLSKIKKCKKKRNIRTINYLEFTVEDFKDKFPILLKDHHIDHKIPLSWFKANVKSKIANHLDNLQQIKASENRIKHNYFCSPVNECYYELAKPYIKKIYIEKVKIEKIG